MTDSRRDKVVQILMYATMINDEPTKKELTGDKPTVFVVFSGHTNDLDIDIYSDGWGSDNYANAVYNIDLDGNTERDFSEYREPRSKYERRAPADELLTEALSRLKIIYNEWRDK